MADEQPTTPPPPPEPEPKVHEDVPHPPPPVAPPPPPPPGAATPKRRMRPVLKHRASLASGRRMLLRNIVIVEEPPEPPEPPDPNVVAREKYEEAKEKHRKEMLGYLDSIRSERNRFIETKTDQSKSYDQTILTFSAGAIGLSITFVEKIAPTPSVPILLY